MATETIATQPLLVKTFYDRVLLDRVKPILVHAQFGQVRNIPAATSKTASFRRLNALAANTTPLVEGTTPAGTSYSVSEVTATVAQYGDFIAVSDMLAATSIHPLGTETVELLGDQAGDSLDRVYRDAMNTGTNVVYADAVANRAAVGVANVIDSALVKYCATQLANARAMRINGGWVAIIHPFAKHTLTNDSAWIDVTKYSRPDQIFAGEIGTLHGVRFVESPNAAVFTGAGALGIDVYSTLIMGANAYGVIGLDTMALQQIFKPLGSAGSADPLDQRMTWGWKAAATSKILNDTFIIRAEHAVVVTQ